MLTIRNLSKTYANGIQALRGITLEIDKGIFGLLGPNGAGKSSLMRTLATLQPADAGSIALEDIDLLAEPPLARWHLGYLPQDFGVYPQVSAEELLNQLAVFKASGRASRCGDDAPAGWSVNIQLELDAQKLRTTGSGEQEPLPLDVPITVALSDADGELV